MGRARRLLLASLVLVLQIGGVASTTEASAKLDDGMWTVLPDAYRPGRNANGPAIRPVAGAAPASNNLRRRRRVLEHSIRAEVAAEESLTVHLNEDLLPFDELFQKDDIELPLMLSSGEVVVFLLGRTPLLPEGLRDRFPGIVTYEGPSMGRDEVLRAVVDYSPIKGLRAFIRGGRKDFWIDPLHREEQVYRAYSLKPSEASAHAWSCQNDRTHADEAHAHIENEARRLSESDVDSDSASSPDAVNEYIFTIAMVANGQYSSFHGNTKQTVLAEIVTLMNRVNGIYKRELGVFFQLHEQSDDMICLHPCSHLANDAAVLDDMDGFVEDTLGIDLDTIDIGHALTTGSGGLAYISSLCGPNKLKGTTGLSQPFSDMFYVDYVSHELAHMLGGEHVFSDCDGDTGQLSPVAAVEPGSGSTIMGYAGICGDDNLQTNSDPYFHGINLEQMAALLVNVADRGTSCGTVRPTNRTAPAVHLQASCVLPAASPFQIELDASDADVHYNFDTVDVHRYGQDYSDASLPKFRSWVPTARPYRSFPNMYYLVHGIVSTDEVLPEASAALTFRATARQTYSALSLDDDDLDHAGFGAHAHKDMAVEFLDTILPLEVQQDELPAALVVDAPFEVTWNVGGTRELAEEVHVMFGVDTLPYTGDSIEQLGDLEEVLWLPLATVNNSGTTNVTIPRSSHVAFADGGNHTVHLMVRSTQTGCFFFDVAPGITLMADVIIDPEDGPASLQPSSAPSSRASTMAPSSAPTEEPDATSGATTDVPRPADSPTFSPDIISAAGARRRGGAPSLVLVAVAALLLSSCLALVQ